MKRTAWYSLLNSRNETHETDSTVQFVEQQKKPQYRKEIETETTRVQYGLSKNLLGHVRCMKGNRTTNNLTIDPSQDEDLDSVLRDYWTVKSRQWKRSPIDLNSWPEHITPTSVPWRTAAGVQFSAQKQLYFRHSQKSCVIETEYQDLYRSYQRATETVRLQCTGLKYVRFGVLRTVIWLLSCRVRQGMVWNKFTAISEISAVSTLKLDVTYSSLNVDKFLPDYTASYSRRQQSALFHLLLCLNGFLRHVLYPYLHCI
jgi:hypothetical protein